MSEGRALGIDFGSKRIGFAVSDDLGWVARPLEVYQRKGGVDGDLARIKALIEAHEIVRVVVGVPYRMDGSVGPQAERTLVFIDALRDGIPGIPIETIDEALTSFAADELMTDKGLNNPKKRKAWRDAYAAAVILQEALGPASGAPSAG